jgi:hypothetical protein
VKTLEVLADEGDNPGVEAFTCRYHLGEVHVCEFFAI